MVGGPESGKAQVMLPVKFFLSFAIVLWPALAAAQAESLTIASRAVVSGAITHATASKAFPTASSQKNLFPAGPLPSADAPMAVAVDPARQRLYAVHRASYSDTAINDGFLATDRVSVVDLSTGKIIALVPVGKALSGDGQGIALDSARNRLYVPNADDGTLSVIDTSSNAVEATIPTGGNPAGVAVDPSTGNIYVAVASTNSMLILGPSGATAGTVELSGSPQAVAVDPATHLVYLTVNAAPWTVVVLNGTAIQAELPCDFLFSLKSIAVDPGSRVYVSDHDSGNVSIVQTSGGTLTELARFQAALYPDSIAVDPATHWLYVADTANNRVSSFDSTGTKMNDIAVLRHPSGMAVDGAGKAYVADNLSDSVSVLDLNLQSVAATIPLGTLDSGIAYDRTTKRVYAANFVADAVSVVDTVTGHVLANWPCGAGPWAVAVDPSVHQVYALDASDGTLAVLSTIDGTLKATIPIGSVSAGVVAVDPASHRVYASSGNLTTTVTVLDGASNQVIATILVGSTPVGIAIDQPKGRVLVANQQSGTISVIDASSNQVIDTWHPKLPNVWGLAIDTQLRRVYATIPPPTLGSFTGLEILDADTGEFLGQLQSGSRAVLVTVNPANHQVFFSDSDAGTVTIVDGQSGNILATTASGTGAHSLSLDPDSGIVYVGNYLDGTISAVDGSQLSTRPGIASGGVVNAASFGSGAIAPGEIITIFGTAMGPSNLVTLALDATGKVSAALSGTQVLFDGTPAPLIYTSASQISAVVPYAIAGQSSTQLQVAYQRSLSAPITVPVTASVPEIFTMSGGRGQAAALNQDYTVNSIANPAAPDSVVILYATGEGQTSPDGVDGLVIRNVLPKPVLPVKATVGGRDVPVEYAGAAPGFVAGVLQVNLKLPADITLSNAVPVSITVGSSSSQAGVTIAIR